MARPMNMRSVRLCLAEADENMSYDETVYAVTVNIADAGDGELDVKIIIATVQIIGQQMTLTRR